MSVHPYKTRDGMRYQVRWREGGRVRTRSLTSKSAANALDIKVKAGKLTGEPIPRPGRETLAEAYETWWRLHGSTLAQNTQEAHRAVWNAHVKDRFDHHRLSELAANPLLIDELTADMRARSVGNAAQRRVLAVLSSVLTICVKGKKIATNPVHATRKPPATRERYPRPMPPVIIERIRLQMLRRKTLDSSGARNQADACLVALMAYAGLRPGEALALTWRDVGTRTLSIDKAVAVGEEAPTKTRNMRTVPLIEALAYDLQTLRLAQGNPGDDQPLFPGANGVLWSRWQFRNWRKRVWKPVLQALADCDPPQPWLARERPYDCRGSFVSLQLRAGARPLEVAEWTGHATQVMFKHYANVIEELVGEPVIPAAEQIARARDAVTELERKELDKLMADLIARPTTSAGGDDEDGRAADFFYGPDKG